ncbi:MAG: 1-deoxy-D-xylulose-5-phosphate reductoisomerase, partial [Dehalococcoidia bacterium]|nr:1-deoxy-D-xylulose-5-phosphate reductoisomerase [Dehalococcoidia bacterium]
MESRPRRVAVLGSTGSVGSQALDVIRQLPGHFEAVALAAGRNADLLARQVAEVRPKYVFSEVQSPALREAAELAGARFIPTDEMAVAGDK